MKSSNEVSEREVLPNEADSNLSEIKEDIVGNITYDIKN